MVLAHSAIYVRVKSWQKSCDNIFRYIRDESLAAIVELHFWSAGAWGDVKVVQKRVGHPVFN